MNKVILTLILTLLIAAGCEEGSITTGIMTSQETDTKALVGYEVDGVGVGGVFTWHPIDDVEWGPEPTGAGFWIGADASWVLSAEDTPDPAPVPAAWLDGLTAVPYGRIEFTDAIDDNNFGDLQPQWVVGTKFLLDEAGRASVSVEYSDGDTFAPQTYIGAFYKW